MAGIFFSSIKIKSSERLMRLSVDLESARLFHYYFLLHALHVAYTNLIIAPGRYYSKGKAKKSVISLSALDNSLSLFSRRTTKITICSMITCGNTFIFWKIECFDFLFHWFDLISNTRFHRNQLIRRKKNSFEDYIVFSLFLFLSPLAHRDLNQCRIFELLIYHFQEISDKICFSTDATSYNFFSGPHKLKHFCKMSVSKYLNSGSLVFVKRIMSSEINLP